MRMRNLLLIPLLTVALVLFSADSCNATPTAGPTVPPTIAPTLRDPVVRATIAAEDTATALAVATRDARTSATQTAGSTIVTGATAQATATLIAAATRDAQISATAFAGATATAAARATATAQPTATPVPPTLTPTPRPATAAMRFRHTQPGVFSEVFTDITGTPGSQVSVTLAGPPPPPGSTTPSVDAPAAKTATIGADGTVTVGWVIRRFGTYNMTGTVGTQTISGSVLVQ